MITQTSFVDVSVVDTTSTGISISTSVSSLDRSTVTQTKSDTEVETRDSAVPTNPPFMFSTSMAPTRRTPVGREEELFTTAAPTIREEHDDVTTDSPDLDIDNFVKENETHEESASHRGDTFPEPQSTTETESESEPVEEPDDHSVIEISTIQPDVPIPDASLSTEPMFAEGKTLETILGSRITDTTMEVFSSAEPPSSFPETDSTTQFPHYDTSIEEIDTDSFVEGLPPAQPTRQDLSFSSSDSPSVIDGTAIPTDTSFIGDTQPGSKAEITTSTPTQTTLPPQDVEAPAVKTTSATVTGAAVLIDTGTSAEDVTSSSGVQVFDESTIQVPEHSGESLTEGHTATDIGKEFFTSAPMVPAVNSGTVTQGTVVAEEQLLDVTAATQKQNTSGKTC